MNIFLKVFFGTCFLSSFTSLYAQSECPPGSMKVEFFSAASEKKKILCQVKKDGKFETVADITDGIPAVKVETKSAGAQDFQKISAYLQELFKIIAGEGKKSALAADFNVSNCDQNKLEWAKLFLSNGTRKVIYAFSKDCDVNGEFLAKLNSPFPMKLKLRHLSNFQLTDMSVIVQMKMNSSSLNIHFESPQGLVVSPQEKIIYKGHYSIDIDLMSGSPFPGTGKGEITILKINDKEVNITTPILDV